MDYRITQDPWDYVVVEGDPGIGPGTCLAVADIDGDGKNEIVAGGINGLKWFHFDGSDSGRITDGEMSCGLAVADLARDGTSRIIGQRVLRAGQTARYEIYWLDRSRPAGDWTVHLIDPDAGGPSHDLYPVDIDKDGVIEIVANIGRPATPGLYIYKPAKDPAKPWQRFTVNEGLFSEGIAVADLDGDGRNEIVHGPYWFDAGSNALEGPWKTRVYARGLREMCRTAVVDVTGDGTPSIVACESEYEDGRFCWFEREKEKDGTVRWIEHRLMDDMCYGHSLNAYRDGSVVHIFNAEMSAGGWKRPRNYNARLLDLVSADNGGTWELRMIDRGEGTHQAVVVDVDGDGRREVVGKLWGHREHGAPQMNGAVIQIWRPRRGRSSPLTEYEHTFIDRDKGLSAIDIVPANLGQGGRQDVFVGSFRYNLPDWVRATIPGDFEVINRYDLDGDGRDELIALKRKPLEAGSRDVIRTFTSDIYWLKERADGGERFEPHLIGRGRGDWVHGSLVAPLLDGGRPALIAAYHSANNPKNTDHYPEIFVPDPADLTKPWRKSDAARIQYGEEMVAIPIAGSGRMDVVAGFAWLENHGDGTFTTHRFLEGVYPARMRAIDVNGDGRLDLVMAQESVDWSVRKSFYSPLIWVEQPDDPRRFPWKTHTIDQVRCAHSIDVADFDGDGEMEIVVGEHDPFDPYRSRCRLFFYKKDNAQATCWRRYTIDGRFEHHDGAKVITMADGRPGILSHGWMDADYVHLWTRGTARGGG